MSISGPSVKNNFKYIDAIRGFAILGVVAVHVGQKCNDYPSLLTDIATYGNYGVQLFFVASAFTLCLSIDNRKQSERNLLRNYFLRRYFRIAPLYYFGIVFYFFVRIIGKGVFPPEGYNFFNIITNITFLHGFNPNTFNYIVPGGWSIAVEFVFYIFFPFLIGVIKNWKHALIFVLLTIILSITGSYFWELIYGTVANKNSFQYYVFTTQFSNFSIGILLFYIWKNKELISIKSKLNFTVLSLLSFLVFISVFTGAIRFPQIPYYHLLRPTIFSFSFLFLFYSFINKEWYFFINPITIEIGKVSYSIYITHFIFAWFISPQIMTLMKSHIDFNRIIFFTLSYIITLTGSFLFSQITYLLIEKKGMEFAKKLIS